MNEQQRLEIGARLRELRENSAETNRSIGDYVGVAERTVAEWVSGRQGMTYDNAQKVAELFEVDLDWFWRGKEPPDEPDLMAALGKAANGNGNVGDRLTRIEKQIAANSQMLERILELMERREAELAEDVERTDEPGEHRKPEPGQEAGD